ncbi:transglycosylase domain-containing protein [Deinococcus sp. QL22]|uniref:transglycosylase domain-containing protein n=1 Tax=Deinococcus sp. QL22 TaxID=2939437 RepID=UPI002016C51C|nr:transglycosylase domain-containing protein [Deinococcus sp. QL22]UQN05076.1 penicillin-binding protein [Deinococcus sp. QL22]
MRFFTGIGVLLLAGVAGAGGLWYAWGRDLPNVSDLDVLEFSGQTRVYDRNNALIGTLTPSLSSSGGVNRDLIKLNQISPWLQDAVVTSEDRRFFKHNGVDYIGIGRGLIKGVLQNDLEGGSSITQQVVKNTLLADLNSARTAERKFKEAVLAYQLERSFDKKQILNAYLNVIYWGDGGRSDIVGAETAARAYFRKGASDLNLAESVYLATIIPAPNRRYKSFQAFRPLMKDLLGRMVEDARITQAQADAAWRTPIYPAGWRIGWNTDGSLRSAVLENPARLQSNLNEAEAARGGNRYQYLAYLQAVEKELTPIIGRKALYGGGKIYTGMDLQTQQSAERASRNADLPDGATLGIALVSPKNGEVLALVGQKLTGDRPSDWNNATQARRQVGSSVKPLLYTLALQRGWKQSDTVLDAPIRGDYQPKNYDGRWTGRYVTMRYSLDHSLNLTTVRTAQAVGIKEFEAKLRELGLTPPPNAGLSLSIGTLEASPLQLASAYASFANGGLYYAPTLVRRVQDTRDKVLYTRPAPVAKRVWDTQTAWLGLDMLRGVVNDLDTSQGGLAVRARIPGVQVGGKTGTTNEIKDLWFAGVTPTVAGAVWVGKQEGGPLPSWAYSGEIPTPIWQAAVAGALAGKPSATFAEPGGITYRVVRQVNMAFLDSNAEEEPVARDGEDTAGRGGFFSRRSRDPVQTEAQPRPAQQPTEPEVTEPEPVQEVVPVEPVPEAVPEEAMPIDTAPVNTVPVEPVPEEAVTEPVPSEIVTPEPVPAQPTQPEPLPSEPEPAPTPEPVQPDAVGTVTETPLVPEPVPAGDPEPLPDDSFNDFPADEGVFNEMPTDGE